MPIFPHMTFVQSATNPALFGMLNIQVTVSEPKKTMIESSNQIKPSFRLAPTPQVCTPKCACKVKACFA